MDLIQGRRLDSRWRSIGTKLPREDWLAEWKWSVHGRKEDRISCLITGGEGQHSHERFQAPEAYSFSQTTNRLIAAPKRARPRKIINKYMYINSTITSAISIS